MPNRDEFATCPDCAVALQAYGRRFGCDQCGGTLVSGAELLELLSAFDTKQTRTLEWPRVDHPSRRRCPCCEAMMVGGRMEGVPIERCVEHGVWFDHGELAKVIAPEADAEAFARDYQERQAQADYWQYGRIGVVIRDIYRAVKARRGPR